MKKIIGFTLLGLCILLVIFIWLYFAIHNDWKDQQDAARKFALEHTEITTVSGVETFYGEQPIQIVYGSDDQGDKWIMWLHPDEQYKVELLNRGISKNDVIKRLREDVDGAEIELLRTMPGVWDGDYAWELFYKQQEGKDYRYYYRYYRFEDGKWLETLRLDQE